ncbi:MAG: 4Fe-4S binding protein [Methanoregula sp.]|nr:4Fe-4S binding protein [Methanoregula sp.]
MTTGLAYPACATVCPKGRSGCPSPGHCFLYTDADGNSLCDYTSSTGSATTSGSIPSRPGASSQASSTAQVTTIPVTDPTMTSSTASSVSASQVTQVTLSQDTATSELTSSSSSGTSDILSMSAFMTEAVIFLLFTGIIFGLVRSGVMGIRVEKTLPALALSSLFGLCLSLIATSFITGGAIAGTTSALIYMGAGTLLAMYLWKSGVMTRRIVLGAAGMGTLAGFVFIAPIMPMELGGVINVITGASTPTFGVLIICTVIALALIVGRTFCGNICPVGSLQELAYAVPVRKLNVRNTKILELIRLAVFAVTVIAAIYLIDLMAYTGLYDLFSLTLSAGLVIAAGLIVLSVFLYRPICRILCPFGALFSLFAEFSLFRMRRTKTCIGCKKCEIACPARTAGKDDSKRECYICGRCTDACPIKDALVYRR